VSLFEFMRNLPPEAKAELRALEDKQKALAAELATFAAKYPCPKHYEWGFSAGHALRPWFVGHSDERNT
jgi:hypothetical protein